jgi:hypothetical protein
MLRVTGEPGDDVPMPGRRCIENETGALAALCVDYFLMENDRVEYKPQSGAGR